ncbi:MAG TPA: hypothetical protein VIL85_16635 [Thermomicrobiales bacterium]|jgi:hypothetical protein
MATPPPYNPQNIGGYPQQPNYPAQPGFGGPPPGYSAPPPTQRSKRGLWIGGGIAVILLCCCIAGVFAAVLGPRLVRGTAGNITGARDATTGYYDAVRDHDWGLAHDYLSSSLGASVPPSALQSLWTVQELSKGRVVSFSATNTNVSTNNGRTTAVVTGTVRYDKGSSETKTVNLVKEGSDWLLASLP